MMPRFLFWFFRTRSFLVINRAKLPEIVYKNPVFCSAFCNNIFVRISIFLTTSFEKQISELFEPSNDLRVALGNCVQRYKRIISEKQQQKFQ